MTWFIDLWASRGIETLQIKAGDCGIPLLSFYMYMVTIIYVPNVLIFRKDGSLASVYHLTRIQYGIDNPEEVCCIKVFAQKDNPSVCLLDLKKRRFSRTRILSYGGNLFTTPDFIQVKEYFDVLFLDETEYLLYSNSFLLEFIPIIQKGPDRLSKKGLHFDSPIWKITYSFPSYKQKNTMTQRSSLPRTLYRAHYLEQLGK
jgi:hypothetical protein